MKTAIPMIIFITALVPVWGRPPDRQAARPPKVMPPNTLPSNIRTVFVIVMENQNWSQIKDSSSAPYINDVLLPRASHAEQYFSPPGLPFSLPNYLWLEAGTNFGIADDNPPGIDHQSTTMHLVTLLHHAKISWKAYAENISGNACPLTDNGLYAVRHDPFVYFDDVTGRLNADSAYCTAHIRPFTELASDLAGNKVAAYNFIIPNLCDDMHTACTGNSIRQGDAWLSQNVPTILGSQAYQTGALFITWDQPATANAPIGMIVLSPFGKGHGYQNSIHYTHSSMLRTVEEIFGLSPLLNDAAQQTDLSDLFMLFP